VAGSHLRVVPGGRTLPHNLEAEASVLGGIILRNEVLAEIPTLEDADFYDLKHRIIFGAIRNLEAARSPIDVVTIENEIARQGKLDAIGGVAFLGELTLRVPTADNVVTYAEIVREKHLVRSAALAAGAAVERAYGWEHEADEYVGELIADLQRLDERHRGGKSSSPVITVNDSLLELMKLAATPVFETPFPALNKILGFGGLLATQVYYLAGGTGFGKTSFIATIAAEHAESGRPVVIAFYEMFAAYYTARMAAPKLGVHANRIIRGEVDHDAIRRVLRTEQIYFLDAPTLATLKRVAEQLVKDGKGAPLIIVDYVQLLGDRIMQTQARPDPRVANAQASAGLRQLAKDTGAAIICVSAAGRAASRELTKDVRKKPARELIDASRESGAIEFDGAGVIVLSVSDEKDGDENIATISVAKARFGETSHIDARYMGATGAWRSLDRVTKLVDLNPKADDGSVRKAILEVLAKHPGGLSGNKIIAATKKGRDAIFSELKILQEEGICIHKGRGFGLAEVVSEPVPALVQAALSEVL